MPSVATSSWKNSTVSIISGEPTVALAVPSSLSTAETALLVNMNEEPWLNIPTISGLKYRPIAFRSAALAGSASALPSSHVAGGAVAPTSVRSSSL